MKKNKAMRLAAILMVVCLVATCAICGTLAKYTTSGAGADETDVAKWGVTINNFNLENLFAHPDTPATVVIADTIAPGTNGSATITVAGEGTPDVAYSVNVLVGLEEHSGGTIPAAVTDHVNWSLTGSDGSVVAEGDWATFSAALTGLSGEYGPGTAFPIAPDTYTLAWDWPFEKTDGTAQEKAAWDAVDTTAGNLASSDGVTIDFALQVSATQIDHAPTP